MSLSTSTSIDQSMSLAFQERALPFSYSAMSLSRRSAYSQSKTLSMLARIDSVGPVAGSGSGFFWSYFKASLLRPVDPDIPRSRLDMPREYMPMQTRREGQGPSGRGQT